MAENFVLEVRKRIGYDELLPSTSLEALVDGVVKVYIDVVIPVTTEATQTIAVGDITANLAQVPFEIFLKSGEMDDYNTLSQVESQEGQIVITRLYSLPTNEITITLLFYERKGG